MQARFDDLTKLHQLEPFIWSVSEILFIMQIYKFYVNARKMGSLAIFQAPSKVLIMLQYSLKL